MWHAAAPHGRRKGGSVSGLLVAVLAAVACVTAFRMASGGARHQTASQLHSSSGGAPALAAAAATPARAADSIASAQQPPHVSSPALPELLDMAGSAGSADGGAQQGAAAQAAVGAAARSHSPVASTEQPAAGVGAQTQQQQHPQEGVEHQQEEMQRDAQQQLAASQNTAQPQPQQQQQEQQALGQQAAGAAVLDGGATLGVAKVALLFLTRGPLPMEPVWREWLQGVEGLLPSFQLAALQGCSKEQIESVRSLMKGSSSSSAAGGSGAELYRRQHLFSIYVHSPPEYAPYPEDSLFYGREVSQRIATAWASHTLVSAVRHLLRDALADPLNKRFILMSESDVPLWPAGLLYLQVLAEPASRVHACGPRGPGDMGWTDPDMADLLGIPREQWRKSSQWSVLSRRHAELIVNDTELDALFARECYSEMDIITWQLKPGGRWCVSDEHYPPVLLAAAGEARACACSAAEGAKGTATFTLWGRGSAHPRTFVARELTLGILRYVRNCSAAAAEAALDRFPALLVQPEHWSVAACEAAAAASAAVAQELAAAEHAAGAATAARVAEVAALVAAGGAAPPPAAAKSFVLPAAEAAAAVADQTVVGAVPLLPPYQCNLVLRKVAPGSAEELVQKLQGGLLLSRAQAAAAAAAAPASQAANTTTAAESSEE